VVLFHDEKLVFMAAAQIWKHVSVLQVAGTILVLQEALETRSSRMTNK
jgi:hypothetical protein